MKKILVSLVIAFSVHSVAMAQDGQHMRRSPEDRAKNQVEMLQPLKLTDDQQKRIYDLNINLAESAGADASLGEDAKAERVKMFQAKRMEGYKSILTAEQYVQFETLQAERKDRMKARRMERNSTN